MLENPIVSGTFPYDQPDPGEEAYLDEEREGMLLDLMLEPAPLPLDLYGDDDYSVAAGILVDDYDRADDGHHQAPREQGQAPHTPPTVYHNDRRKSC